MQHMYPTNIITRVASLLLMACIVTTTSPVLGQPQTTDVETTTHLVVMIKGELDGAPTMGAGIIFGRDANRIYIVTANHTVRRGGQEARRLQVLLKGVPDRWLDASLTSHSDSGPSGLDIAVLAVEGLDQDRFAFCDLPLDRLPASLASSGTVSRGQLGVHIQKITPDLAKAFGLESPQGALVANVKKGSSADKAKMQRGDVILEFDHKHIKAADHLRSMVANTSPGAKVPIKVLRKGKEQTLVATISVNPEAAEKKKQRIEESLRRGTGVYPVGYPNGAPWGMPVVPDRVAQIVGQDITFQSAFISNGHSGGALMTERGEIVGLIRSDQPPFGVALYIGPVMKKLRQWGYPVYLRAPGALHRVASSGNVDRVRILLTHCVDVEERKNGWTPLLLAVLNRHSDVVNLLLASGANIHAGLKDERNSGHSPLHIAAQKNFKQISQILLRHGAETDLKNNVGLTPLEYAVKAGAVETAIILLKHGANPNTSRQLAEGADSPLGVAVKNGNIAMVKTLLANGASVKWESPAEMRTPLHLAAKKGQAQIVSELLTHGADVDHPFIEGSDYTPLHEAVEAARYTEDRAALVQVMKTLLEHGADVTRVSIRTAVYDEAADVVEVLLAHGADTNKGDFLCDAIENKSLKVLEVLLAYRVDVNRVFEKSQYAPLHCAVAKGNVDAATALIKAGARVNQQTRRGHQTPLHVAVLSIDRADGPPISTYLTIVNLLLKAGADVNARTKTGYWGSQKIGGRTPLSLALPMLPQYRNEIVPLLRAHGAKE